MATVSWYFVGYDGKDGQGIVRSSLTEGDLACGKNLMGLDGSLVSVILKLVY